MPTPIALGRVPPLGSDLEAIAADILHGLQYSFISAAAHPEIRLPFGSLEETFQDAIGLRPAEQRWVYHSRARRIAMAPPAIRQRAFGRYGLFGAEEFACGGLAIAYQHLSAERHVGRRVWRAKRSPGQGPVSGDLTSSHPSRRTLALYITEVSCLDRTDEATKGEEIAIGGLALDPLGGVVRVGRFLVRDDFEHGVRKEYGVPGRKFCEFRVPDSLGDQPVTYGAAAFLEVADRAGFSESLAGAWAKASPILRHAVETRIAGARAATISRAAGWVVERFVRWLGEEFQDEVLPPGLAFAGLDARLATVAGDLGQFTFAGQRGRYRVGGQWRVSCA
ncbi:MAG: hypothetical protein ACREM9_06905 [Gemmatimonadales bacterium]